MFDVPADGHCLFAALAHQLAQQKKKRREEEEEGGEGEGAAADDADAANAAAAAAAAADKGFAFTVASLRALAARHIREHAPDFEPFIGDDEIEETAGGGVGAGEEEEEQGEGKGGDSTEEALSKVERYCRRLEGTAAWGGQPELQALASALPATIRVLSAGMEPVVVEGGEGAEGEKGEKGKKGRPVRCVFPFFSFSFFFRCSSFGGVFGSLSLSLSLSRRFGSSHKRKN